ncbi:hypothetical protein DPMN_086051 [Dreissena polymorpha]|uniref:Uncharacterized protein n=1 Tax=Dreissena polymorpha TaxID=45954 RepID=A0A9D3YI47_DREPO|nr:hypothetical protein DPMN_086051 [Dreissena polymorpha]
MMWFSKIRMELEMLSEEYALRNSQYMYKRSNGVLTEWATYLLDIDNTEVTDAILSGIKRRHLQIHMESTLRALAEGCTDLKDICQRIVMDY